MKPKPPASTSIQYRLTKLQGDVDALTQMQDRMRDWLAKVDHRVKKLRKKP